MNLFAPAVKERLKARVAIDGPTGSGKTWTALQWARILAGPDGPIGLVDTENRSAAYYAPNPGAAVDRLNWWDAPYEFGHLPQSPPYDPRRLVDIIDAAGNELGDDGVLVVDSLTHYWNGEGGTLDIVENAGQRQNGPANRFAGWKEGTPAQRHLLDAIIHARCHVIVTMRSRMEYVLEQGDGGKQRVRKLGMAPEQRNGVEYEFTVVVDMDLEHRLVVSKSRCSEIADVVATAGRSADVAQRFADWLATGAEPPPNAPAPDPKDIQKMQILFNELGVKGRDDRIRNIREIIGRPVESSKDCTPEEAGIVLAELRARKAKNVVLRDAAPSPEGADHG